VDVGEDLLIQIKKAKRGNKESMMYIIKKFDPLIKKYTRKLNYEDADSELVEKIIEIIYKIPELENEGLSVSYIYKSITNEYIRLSKQNNIWLSTIYLDVDLIDNIPQSNNDSNSDFFELLVPLNFQEKQVIIYKYYYGYKASDIAKIMKLSRQSIYKKEKKAIKLIKESYLERT